MEITAPQNEKTLTTHYSFTSLCLAFPSKPVQGRLHFTLLTGTLTLSHVIAAILTKPAGLKTETCVENNFSEFHENATILALISFVFLIICGAYVTMRAICVRIFLDEGLVDVFVTPPENVGCIHSLPGNWGFIL